MTMSNELEVGKVYSWSVHPRCRYQVAVNARTSEKVVVKTTDYNGKPVMKICPAFMSEPSSGFKEAEHHYVLSPPSPGVTTIKYKYNEPALLEDLSKYVDDTYSEHYAQTSFQSTEVIIDSGHGVGFCLGNVLKYANRYGRKDGFNRKDLFKILHYTLIAIFIHDRDNKDG